MYDYHVHSTYSDGAFLEWMIEAAEDAGLSGLGFADHCSVVPTDDARKHRERMGFNLDVTYERRREAIDRLREGTSLRLFDAVEMDYHPEYEPAIEAFLAEADFEYAIGSVHDLEGVNIHQEAYFAQKSPEEREDLVDRYFEKLIGLINSELFAIAGHVDLIERNPALRGYATEDHYERVARAFTDSRTVPEINAGRVTSEYGEFHPSPTFLETLLDHGVLFVVGSDAHEPAEIGPRVEALRAELEGRPQTPVELGIE